MGIHSCKDLYRSNKEYKNLLNPEEGLHIILWATFHPMIVWETGDVLISAVLIFSKNTSSFRKHRYSDQCRRTQETSLFFGDCHLICNYFQSPMVL